ncbi:LysM domain-containing protein [Streptomyces sp. NPDC019443]|uniref:LysM domain-containing protein n=1 Tax=Streptomyces sp. NPDC019443 TaxID=3365061 RepID=UPI003788EF3F
MFSVTSRYRGIDIAHLTLPDGRDTVYVRRRFLPVGPPAAVVAEHTVAQGERLDNITARYLGDPEQFWQVCDANGAMRPGELTSLTGRRLVVPVPQGGL